jgi:hypothetical protein
VRFDRLPFHKQQECWHRLVPCPFECNDKVRAFELFKHKRSDCKKRKVRCRVTCGQEMFARDRNKHETEICADRLVGWPPTVMGY